MNCNQPSCQLCKIDREGCQCLTKDVGCWYCAPNKFSRPECGTDNAFETFKKQLYDQVTDEIQKVVKYFAVKSGLLSDHIYEKQKKILAAKTHEEASKIFDRLMGWVIHADGNWLWGLGKAGGPPYKRTSDKAAKKAESLARLLEEKGDQEGAARQLKRAADIRKQLHISSGVEET